MASTDNDTPHLESSPPQAGTDGTAGLALQEPDRRVDLKADPDLPTELVLQIFADYFALPTAATETDPRALLAYYRRLCKLCSVCPSWRNELQSKPQLWSRVSGCLPPAGVEAVLTRSQNHPIDVEYILDVGTASSMMFQAEDAFLDQVIPHIDRWKTARLTVRLPERTWARLAVPAPQLESLWLVPRFPTLGSRSTLR